MSPHAPLPILPADAPCRAIHALVIGATGGAGRAIALALTAHGARVTLAGRAPQAPAALGLSHLPWRPLDLARAADLRESAQGCNVIVHAANPARYAEWDERQQGWMRAILDAVPHPETTVVLPGNVYALPNSLLPLDEDTAPPRRLCRKGQHRLALETLLRDAAHAGRCRALVLRAGDFFGPHASSTWFAQVLLGARDRHGQPRHLQQPGVAGVGHQWNYLPDYARTVALLLAHRHQLPAHTVLHTAGHWDPDGQTLLRHVADALTDRNGRRPAVRAFPWWALRLASSVHPMSREVLAMRRFWRQPLQMDNSRLCAVLGQPEPHTPWTEAVRASLADWADMKKA